LIEAALLALMSLGALYLVVSRKSPQAIQPDPYLPAVARVSTPQPGLPEKRVPDPTSPEPVGSTVNSKDRPTFEAKRGSWGVIAATYTSFHAAQKRAEAIERRAPQLHPSVFPHDPEGKYFYVILGSGLTEDAAARLRKRAVQHGAPGDSYVTKLDER
jgi:hypothetical protein